FCITTDYTSHLQPLSFPTRRSSDLAIMLSDRNFTQTGDYTLSLNNLNVPAGASPIGYSQIVSGTHTPIAELDFYTFTGAIGDRVIIRMTSAFVPAAEIRRPDGTSLCSTDGYTSKFLQLECTLDRAGTHAIMVSDRNFTQTGDYT